MIRNRSGGIAVIVALMVGVLAGFAALVLDLGYARLIQAQLRMSTDAAALAAVQQLDGTDAGLVNATTAAVAMGAVNQVAGTDLVISGSSVEFGEFIDGSGFTTNDDPLEVNAVRIATTASVPYMLAVVPRALYNATGSADIALSRESLVVSAEGDDASEVDCFLPFALGMCSVSGLGLPAVGTTTWDASSYAAISSAGANKQMFMAAPGGSSTFNHIRFRSQLTSCEAWGALATGDTVALDTATTLNGTWNSSFTRIRNAINASDTSWNTSVYGTQPAQMSGSGVTSYGKTLEGPIPVVTGSGLCTSTRLTNSPGAVVGFLWASVYDVKIPLSSGTFSSATAGRIRMRIDTVGTYEYGTDGGGPGWDVVMTPDQVRFIEDASL